MNRLQLIPTPAIVYFPHGVTYEQILAWLAERGLPAPDPYAGPTYGWTGVSYGLGWLTRSYVSFELHPGNSRYYRVARAASASVPSEPLW